MNSDDDMLAAFDAAFATAPALKDAMKPKNRSGAEKRHAMKHDDKRRNRATGRTAQLNLKVRPELKAQLHEAAKTHERLLADLAEEAFALLLAKLADQKLASGKLAPRKR